MGFFSSLIKGIGAIATPILGALGFVPARAAPAPIAAAALVPSRVQGVGSTIAARAVGGLQRGIPTTFATRPAGVPAPTIHREGPFGSAVTHTPFTGGNGRTVRTTVVTTTNLLTGEIVRVVELDGAPFLMNKDVQKLRQTAKKLTRAHGKLPRRTVKESLTKQLTDAAVKSALDATRCSSHKE